MFTKFAMAAGLTVSTLMGSIAWAAQEQATSEDVQNQTGTVPAAPAAVQAGVAAQRQPPGLASAMANFMVRTGLVVGTDAHGRLVVDKVRPESDAARLGVKPGDVLTSVNGAATPTMGALQNYLTGHSPQSAFRVGMGRGDHNFTRPMGRQMSLMGMSVFADSADRPVVNSVQPGSPAAKAGIKPGDTITSVGRQTTDTMTKFMNMTLPLVRALDPGEKVPFEIARNGRMMKLGVPRPSDSDLQPLTPAEQHVLNQQGGVISPATQETVRPREQRPRRVANNTMRQPRQTGAMAAQTQPQQQQQQPQNNNGGFGGLLGGLGGGGVGTPGTTGTTGMNGQVNSVVAALYGTQQATGTTTGTTTSGSTTANSQNGNRFANAGVVGYVTIQSTVPLSQSANNNGTTTNGTTTNGTTTNGTTGTTTNGTTGTTTNMGATTGLGNSGFGNANAVTGSPIGNGFNGATNGTGANITGTNANGTPNSASVLGSAGGANPVTGNTGTPQGVNPQTGNTGNGTGNVNNQNGNYPSTVSAQVNGLPAGSYSLVVTQYGNCGSASAVATGPTSATLGTFQVAAGGQGTLTNVRVQYPPQAYLGRVVAVVAVSVPQSPATGTSPATGLSGVEACGVFRNANNRQSFTNGAGNNWGNGYGSPFLGTNLGGTRTGTGTTNGTNNGNGNGTSTNPVTGQPMPTPPPVHPLGAAGATGK